MYKLPEFARTLKKIEKELEEVKRTILKDE